MDRELFVQNIKERCRAKGVKPTVACRESGVGVSFINDIERGQTPSVAKVQMLAQYLGCTVSDLLGEGPSQPLPADTVTDEFARVFAQLSPKDQAELGAEVLRRFRQK